MAPTESPALDLHFLNEDGMLACDWRDREAEERAEMEGIGTEVVEP